LKNPEPVKTTAEYYLSRDTIYIGIFGALWGLMEITLGVTLKGLRIPMGGAFLTAISSIIFLTGRYFIRRRGSIILMGAVAAVLKLFSIGTVITGPFIAIIIEATIAEILLILLGVNRISFVLTPAILCLYTIVHPFIAQGLIFGEDIYKIYITSFQKIASLLSIDTIYLGWIVILYALIHLIMGTIAGWMTYSLSVRVSQERARENIRIK
jgi:hypothetical protein